MKMSQRKFLSEMEKLVALLHENFDTRGAALHEQLLSVQGELPKGIMEKMTQLLQWYERAKSGEKLSPADLKQAGYWTGACYPYLSLGAARPSLMKKVNRIVAVIILIVIALVAWKFLH
ncbi:MAG: hypothetical protein Q4G03_02665 [Planctomycetia bacterium]|nr:hypothetical protein [Planctomycetia bacterium]